MENERTRVEQLIISQNLNTNNMYNKERKLKFIQDIYGNYNDVTDDIIISMVRLFNQFGKYEEQVSDRGKDLFDMNTSDFIKFFEYFHWNGNSVLQKKSFIKSYLTWGYNNSLIGIQSIRELEEVKNDNVSKNSVFGNYFKTFTDLQKTLELILLRKNASYNAENEIKLMTVKLAVYLAWFGIKLRDICEIKKDQVNEKHSQIYIESENIYINIPADVMQEIIKYRDINDYKVEEETGQALKESDMLMISIRNTKLTSTYISTLISKMLNNEENDYKQFSYQKIYWSGIYSRAHIYEQEHGRFKAGDTVVLRKVFGESYNNVSRASMRLSDYRDYCKYFYPKEEYKY